MTGHEVWAHGLAGPARRRPLLWLTLGAIAAGLPAGLAAGIAIGRRRVK